MFSGALLFFLGVLLVVTLVYAIVHYFSPKRKDDIEAAKYDMLKDDDDNEVKK